MTLKDKSLLYKKMINKYGDILKSQVIYNIVNQGSNKYDIEFKIAHKYLNGLQYLKDKENKS